MPARDGRTGRQIRTERRSSAGCWAVSPCAVESTPQSSAVRQCPACLGFGVRYTVAVVLRRSRSDRGRFLPQLERGHLPSGATGCLGSGTVIGIACERAWRPERPAAYGGFPGPRSAIREQMRQLRLATYSDPRRALDAGVISIGSWMRRADRREHRHSG